MPNRTLLASLTVAVLAFAGCGSSSNSGTTAATTAPSATQPVQSASYTVSLVPFAGGAPAGSGLAIINIDPASNQLCWQFSQVTNIGRPTVARLYRNVLGATGRNGIPLGHAYTPAGCIHELPEVLALIESKPGQFFVNIHSAQYPFGAVRGPL